MYKFSNTTCPKCGGDVGKPRYIHGGDMVIDHERNRHVGELKRTCNDCGYYWYENSLDNKIEA